MRLVGIEPTFVSTEGLKFEPETADWRRCGAPHGDQTQGGRSRQDRADRRALPGELGEGDGKALSTRYEYAVELSRLAEHYPDKEPDELSTLEVELFLALRCQGKAPATRKKVLAILSGY